MFFWEEMDWLVTRYTFNYYQVDIDLTKTLHVYCINVLLGRDGLVGN